MNESQSCKPQLFENGHRLGPANRQHQSIRLLGRGGYSLWKGLLYFSTSDNSDPNSNGRQYDILLDDKVFALGLGAEPAYGNPVGRDFSVRNSAGNPVIPGAQLESEEEIVEALHQISMLHRPGLARLRQTASLSRGAILEVGPYLGGSTCAIAVAVRGQGRTIISIDVGGDTLEHPNMPSANVIADLKANLAAWGVADDVNIINDWLHNSTRKIERLLGEDRIGLLFIDADGKIAQHMFHLVPFLADDCTVVLDDYLDELKGAGVRDWVERALATESVQQTSVEEGGLWFGRVLGGADRLPVTPFVPNGRHCFISYALASLIKDGSIKDRHVELLEDGRELGPNNALHNDIRNIGKGRLSLWGECLYFSSSDNSDPNANKRRYEVRIGVETVPLNFWRRSGREVFPPDVVAPPVSTDR